MSKPILKIAREVFLKNGPQILTGLGIIGIYGTAYLASKETLKAAKIVKEEGLTSKKDIFKAVWPTYIPSFVTSLATSLCMIKSGQIYNARNAASLALYGLTDQAYKRYSEKVRQTIGDGKECKIRDSISQDRIIQRPHGLDSIVVTGKGEVLVYDTPSDRYFRSNIEIIRRKENEFNLSLRKEGELTLNDLYYELGLGQTKLGDKVGWNIENHILTFKFSSQLTAEQEPCLVLDYDFYPLYS